MTHREAISISVFFTSFGLEGGPRNQRARGGQGVAEEKILRVTTRRKTEKEGQRVVEGEGGVALSLLSVTAAGFMARLLSWCCLLIDIKMRWPVCHFSSFRCLSTFTPPPTPSVLDWCGLWVAHAALWQNLHVASQPQSPPPNPPMSARALLLWHHISRSRLVKGRGKKKNLSFGWDEKCSVPTGTPIQLPQVQWSF